MGSGQWRVVGGCREDLATRAALGIGYASDMHRIGMGSAWDQHGISMGSAWYPTASGTVGCCWDGGVRGGCGRRMAGMPCTLSAGVNRHPTPSSDLIPTPSPILTPNSATHHAHPTHPQALNPVICVLGLPCLTLIWAAQARHGVEPSPISKMAFGCLLQSLAWVVMAAFADASPQHKAPLLAPLLTVLLLTAGELYLSPVGLAFVSGCLPPASRSTALGFWFFSSGAAGCVAIHTQAVHSGGF